MKRKLISLCLLPILALGHWALDFDEDFAAADGAAFSPLQIADCVFWLDASNLELIAKQGASITNIITRPNEYCFIQTATPYSPTVANGAISFDGVDDFMRLDLTNYYASHTVVVAVKRTGTGTGDGYFPPVSYNDKVWVDAGAPFYFQTDTIFSSFPYYLNFGQSGALEAQNYNDNPRRRHVVVVPVNTETLSWPVYVDGQSFGPATAKSWSPSANSDIVIGKQFVPHRRCACEIYEIIFYGRALTATEIATINSYLAKKWNITLTP